MNDSVSDTQQPKKKYTKKKYPKNKWYKVKDLCRLFNTYPTTVQRWEQQGKVKAIRTPSGHRLFDPESIDLLLGKFSNSEEKVPRKVIYCRVSSKKQEDDLQRQITFMQSKYPSHELVKDVGSGINWKRKGLQTILEQSMSGDLKELVVAHKDRLCRIGFELIEWILKKNGTEVIILEENSHKSNEQELAEDLLSIITVFNCRNMGRRRCKE